MDLNQNVNQEARELYQKASDEFKKEPTSKKFKVCQDQGVFEVSADYFDIKGDDEAGTGTLFFYKYDAMEESTVAAFAYWDRVIEIS